MSFEPDALNLINQGRQILQQKQQQQQQQSNIKDLSQEQLIQAGRQIIQQKQDDVQPKEQPRRDTLDILGDLGSRALQIPGQLREQGFSGLKDQFLEQLFSPEETPFETGLGQTLRDVGAPVAGLPGDILQTLQGLSESGQDFFSSIFGGPDSQQINEKIQEETGFGPVSIPFTTEKIQGFVDDMTDGRFRDSPDDVKLLTDIGKDTALLFGGLGGNAQAFMLSTGTSVFGNLASRGLVDAEIIDEGNQDLAKAGMFLFSSFIRPGSMREAGNRFLNRAENSLGNQVTTDAQFGNELRNLHTNLTRAGGETLDRNKPAIELIRSIFPDIQTGVFESRTVTQAVRNLNQRIREVGFQTSAGRQLSRVRGVLQNAAERIGQQNPQFIQQFNEGNSLLTSVNTRNTIGNFLERFLPKDLKQVMPKELKKLFTFGVRGIAKPFDIPVDFIRRLGNPSVLRFWRDFIVNASSENAPATISSFRKFNKEIKKQENQENQS